MYIPVHRTSSICPREYSLKYSLLWVFEKILPLQRAIFDHYPLSPPNTDTVYYRIAQVSVSYSKLQYSIVKCVQFSWQYILVQSRYLYCTVEYSGPPGGGANWLDILYISSTLTLLYYSPRSNSAAMPLFFELLSSLVNWMLHDCNIYYLDLLYSLRQRALVDQVSWVES